MPGSTSMIRKAMIKRKRTKDRISRSAFVSFSTLASILTRLNIMFPFQYSLPL